MTDLSATCGAILTSTTAAAADKATCRDWINRQGHDIDWPGAVCLVALFAMVAWTAPKVLKIVGSP